MKVLKIESVFQVFKGIEELSEADAKLMQKAILARKNAYAPYSNFMVGAAILLDNGEVVTGNNQENASYPSGLCAERTAIYYAGANYPKAKILKLAIVASSLSKKTFTPVPPCGACRQAIAEYEIQQESPIEIYFGAVSGEVYKSDSLANLLPLVFGKSQLA